MYASDPEDEENEAEVHLEEVEAKSGPKVTYVIHINDVIEVPRAKPMKKFVVNVITLYTPIPPMEKARWSKGFRIQLPLPRICSVSRVESFQGAVFIVGERVKNQSSSLGGLTHPSGQIKEGWCGT